MDVTTTTTMTTDVAVVAATVAGEGGESGGLGANTLWILVAGFVVAFFLAFGVGANDVANSFGTSVGAKVLTLRQACVLATVCEIAGAVLIGYKVSDTVRKGIFDVSMYSSDPATLMLGNLAALFGSACWTIIATALSLPISGTHSIIGAVVGFSVVARGAHGINWVGLAKIVASWFVSPLLSGVFSAALFWLIRRQILSRRRPLEAGLRSLPAFYAFTVFINAFSVLHDGPQVLYFHLIPLWLVAALSVAVAGLVAAGVWFVLVPRLRARILARVDRAITDVSDRAALSSAVTADKNGLSSPNESAALDFSTPATMGTGSVMAATVANVDRNQDTVTSITSLQSTCSSTTATPTVWPFGGSRPPLSVIHSQVNMSMDDETSGGGGGDDRLTVITPLNSATAVMATRKRRCRRGCDRCSRRSLASLEVAILEGRHRPAVQRTESVPASAGGGGGGGSGGRQPVDVDGGALERNADSQSLSVSAIPPEEPAETAELFSFLQVLTAIFGSFAHGGNDVSNAIGPLVALYLIYSEGSVAQKAETPIWILLYGGVGISIGLWLWGRRVIETIGQDLTKVTPSNGFSIEIGAASTVLLASKIGLPISTTHCKVGSIVFVGLVKSATAVDWRLFRGIVAAWLLTLPVAGGLSAAIMAIFLQLVSV